jgi:hypothetical protein
MQSPHIEAAVSVLAAHATAAAVASDAVQSTPVPAASVQSSTDVKAWPALDFVYCRVGLQSAVSIVILFVLAMNPYVRLDLDFSVLSGALCMPISRTCPWLSFDHVLLFRRSSRILCPKFFTS